MRLFLSFLSVIFVVASLSGAAFADDKDLVDTKSGLTYTKPPGWALVQTPKKGAVSALHAADDKKSQIEFRFASLTSDKAQQYFTTFHGSLQKAKLTIAQAGESKKFGKLNGKMTEYRAGDGAKAKSVFVFQFTTKKGAWLVVGMFPQTRRDAYLKGLEALLSSVSAE